MKVKMGRFLKNSERRIDIKIDHFDTWNLDHTLAVIILPALIQLKDTKHGVPNDFGNVGGDNSSNQLCFDFYSETNAEAFDEGVKQWEEVLNKMIWAFQQIAYEDYDEKYHHGKADFDFVKTDRKFPNPVTGIMEDTFQMVDKNPGGHWYDYVGHQLHEERIQEGLELFGKYYRALWD